MTQASNIINDFGWKSNDPRRQTFYYLAIFKNQILCLDTDMLNYAYSENNLKVYTNTLHSAI